MSRRYKYSCTEINYGNITVTHRTYYRRNNDNQSKEDYDLPSDYTRLHSHWKNASILATSSYHNYFAIKSTALEGTVFRHDYTYSAQMHCSLTYNNCKAHHNASEISIVLIP